MKKLMCLIMTLLSVNLYSQNKIYVGDKSYPSTTTWNFKSHDYSRSVRFSVAKQNKEGYLLFEYREHGCDFSPTPSDLLIYLENNKSIKCIDRGLKDCVDDKILTLYHFTLSEMDLLKKYRIERIRYSVIPKEMTSSRKSYIAKNLKESFSMSREEKQYETEKEISELYN